MATNSPERQKKRKAALIKEAQKYVRPGRDPLKALYEMAGLWEGRDISIEKIRAGKGREE